MSSSAWFLPTAPEATEPRQAQHDSARNTSTAHTPHSSNTNGGRATEYGVKQLYGEDGDLAAAETTIPHHHQQQQQGKRPSSSSNSRNPNNKKSRTRAAATAAGTNAGNGVSRIMQDVKELEGGIIEVTPVSHDPTASTASLA